MANNKNTSKKDYGRWGGATGIKVISKPNKKTTTKKKVKKG